MQMHTESTEQSHTSKRIARAVKVTGLTVKEFARRAGIPYPSMRDYLGGKRKPGYDAIAAIASLSGLSADQIVLGQDRVDRPDPIIMGVILAGLEDLDSVTLSRNRDERKYRAAEHGRIAALLYTRVAAIEDKEERLSTITTLVSQFLVDVRRLSNAGFDWRSIWKKELEPQD